jgi:hypothetical protein
MPDMFKEIIPSILQTKKSVINDEIDQKDYKSFIINRSLSYHSDCVLFVNEINKFPELDVDMQYQYLLNTIRPMKRKFQPWQKSDKEKNIDCVKEYFGYSNTKAKEALRILSEEQLAEIKIRIDKGGMKK